MTTEHVSVPRWEDEQERIDPEHMFSTEKFMQDEIDALRAILSRATPSDTSFASGLVNEGLDYFYKAGDEGDKEYVRAIRAHIAALEKPSAPRVVTDEDVERAEQAVSQALGDAYDCTRVWEAWSYGTMSEEDFIEVRQQPERLNEIAMAVIESFSVFMTQPMVTDDLVDRLKTACRALIRERVVYAEDVETLTDVVKLVESFATSLPAARVPDGCGHDWEMSNTKPPFDTCIHCGALRDSKSHTPLAAAPQAGERG